MAEEKNKHIYNTSGWKILPKSGNQKAKKNPKNIHFTARKFLVFLVEDKIYKQMIG